VEAFETFYFLGEKRKGEKGVNEFFFSFLNEEETNLFY